MGWLCLSFQVLAVPLTDPSAPSLEYVHHRKATRDFLTSRRARITPVAGRTARYGGKRRAAGLRREEVALLAGVSVDYYTRLERGT